MKENKRTMKSFKKKKAQSPNGNHLKFGLILS